MQSILRNRCVALSIIVAAMVVGFVPSAGAGFFSFTAFAFPNAVQTWAFGINSEGDIVGMYFDPNSAGGYHAYLRRGNNFTALDIAGQSSANGINDKGQIVGTMLAGSFLLTESGGFQAIIVPFPGVSGTSAQGINNSGQVVGWYTNATGQHGFLFSGGVYNSIDVLFEGARNTVAMGINDNGQIVGYFTRNGRIEGFLLSNGTYSAINIPSQVPGFQTQAFGINNLGMIGGVTSDGHGFLVFDSVFMFPIDVPPSVCVGKINPCGGPVAIYGVNNKGAMVATNGGTNAFLVVPTPPGGGENQQ